MGRAEPNILDGERNIFLAKRKFIEYVFNAAYIEGARVTLSQTQSIIDGETADNVSVSDIQTVLNLRDAWKYMLETIDEPLNLEYICKINEMVSRNESLEWGVLRNGKVGISGTNYIPTIPNTEEVIRKLIELKYTFDAVEGAESYFCYAMRSQLFWDGNKRTSTIVASKILIEANRGVLTIGKAEAINFNEALLRLYDTGDEIPLRECLNGCIRTVDGPVLLEETQDL